MNSHLWWVHAHYFPQLVELWSFVSSLLRYITPHRRRIGGPGGGLQWRVRAYLDGVSLKYTPQATPHTRQTAPTGTQQDLQDRVQSPLASSVVRLGTTPMLVRRGFPTHPLEAMSKASNRLQLLARDSALPESTKSVLMLLLMRLILLSVRFILIKFWKGNVPLAISILFWWLSVQHIVSEKLCAKQAKGANHVTRYVSRLSILFWVLTYFV
jgi:hypothetical protein